MDCYVEDPNGRTIYKETKKQYDSFPHHTEVGGVYTFCFSNEFSTFSHKTVYFDFQVGDEPPILPDMSNRVTALTQVGHRTPPREGGRSCRPQLPLAAKRPHGTAVGSSPPFPSAKCRSANRQPTAPAGRAERDGGAALALNLPWHEHPVSIPHKGRAAKLFHRLA